MELLGIKMIDLMCLLSRGSARLIDPSWVSRGRPSELSSQQLDPALPLHPSAYTAQHNTLQIEKLLHQITHKKKRKKELQLWKAAYSIY